VSNIVWSIGRRDSKRCDILLDGNTISKVHASLNYMNGKFYLIDNMSTNGSYLIRNGANIILSTHTELFPDDIIVFGANRFSFDDLLEGTTQSKGREVRVLTISSGQNLNKPTPKPKPRPIVNPSKDTKKIRCMDCMKPILAHSICPSCSSIKHLKGV